MDEMIMQKREIIIVPTLTKRIRQRNEEQCIIIMEDLNDKVGNNNKNIQRHLETNEEMTKKVIHLYLNIGKYEIHTEKYT